jgi:hypothetical protein
MVGMKEGKWVVDLAYWKVVQWVDSVVDWLESMLARKLELWKE